MYPYQELLIRLINEHKSQKVVEVGVDYGGTARLILENCPTITDYYMIDPWTSYRTGTSQCFRKRTPERWEEIYQMAREVTKDFPAARTIRMRSTDAAGCFEVRSLDLVFIDGDHSYGTVKADIAAWRGFVRPGGILCGHDYGLWGVKPAVDEAFSPGEFEVTGRVWVAEVA